MKANKRRTKDVIVSMEPSKHRKVYHRPGCIYVERIKPQNKMIISKKQAQKYRYHSCKYCSGLVGEVRTNELIPVWEEEHHIKIDYIKRTDTLYVRTEIGCWKMFFHDETEKYLLYHRNNYRPELSLEQATHGAYHRQTDVKPEESMQKLINYIVAHDKAKRIIREDYRNLPKSTSRQRKYYRQAQNKIRRRNTRQARQRMDELFRNIENENPEIKKLAFC